MKSEYAIKSKFDYDCRDRFRDENNTNDDFYYYKKPFKENGRLDDLFDFE